MTPFERCIDDPREVARVVAETKADFHHRPGHYVSLGIKSALDAAKFARAALLEGETWKNDTYTVCIYREDEPPPDWPRLLHLSIKRNDRGIIHDWRDLQAIKNALVGPENEAVELYPAESRKVDTANQYHLWVLADPSARFPFGFTGRIVTDDPGVGRAKQRAGAE